MHFQAVRAGLLLALALVPGRRAALGAQTATADSARIERLAALGRLQRMGLQPDVPVRPTIAGVRAGRDEVLDGAVRYLERSLPKTSTR